MFVSFLTETFRVVKSVNAFDVIFPRETYKLVSILCF